MRQRTGSLSSRRILLAAAGSVMAVSSFASAQTYTWTYVAAGAPTWSTATNWLPNTVPNGVGSVALINANVTSNMNIAVDGPYTLSALTFGDPTADSGTFKNESLYALGANAKIIFDNGASNALLGHTTGASATDGITLNLQLNSTLATGTVANDLLDLGLVRLQGVISGTGGILRTSVEANTSNTGQLSLENISNTYSGTTTIEEGKFRITDSVFYNLPSVLGQATSAVVIGTANTVGAANTTGIQLDVTPVNSTAALSFDRDMSFQATGAGRTVVNLNAVTGDGTADTSSLTVTGNMPLGAGATRIYQFNVARAGQLLDLRGVISGGNLGGTIAWNNVSPAFSSIGSDGRIFGTIRLANVSSSYANAQILAGGTLLIDGSVGIVGTNSPIGTQTVGLSDGGSGPANAGLNNGRDSVRSIVMQSGGTSFERDLTPAGGTNAGFAAAGAGGQAAYGTTAVTSTTFTITNGFVFGGVNTSGLVQWKGALNPGNPGLGNGTIATGAATTPVVGANIALLSATGGTVDFSGGIAETSGATTVVRVAINQFRNSPLLDEGTTTSGTTFYGDGVPDALANQLVGTATAGTVVLSKSTGSGYAGGTEVLGGTLLVRSTGTNSATGSGSVNIASAATLGGQGYMAGAVNVNGKLAPGDGIGSISSGTSFTLSSTASLLTQVGPGATIGQSTTNGDLVTTTGAFNMGGATLKIIPLSFTPEIQSNGSPYLYRYTIVTATGGVTGTIFSNLVNITGNQYQYSDGLTQGVVTINASSITLDLTSVPEPGSVMTLAAGAVMLRRRRRVG